MAQFVDYGAPDLLPDFSLVTADCFNILLIEDNVVRPNRQGKNAFLGGRDASARNYRLVAIYTSVQV